MSFSCLHVAFLLVVAAASVTAIDVYTPTDLIVDQGYTAELHNVWTADGFQLGIHRIVPTEEAPRGVALLAHGVFVNAGCWVSNFPQNDLAFMLRDAGFDVWILNFRGTKYSYVNNQYSDKDEEFWDFSFTEMGQIDLPTAVDYILSFTGYSQLTLLAHSEGGSASFVMLSTMADMREKIGLYVALEPAVFVGHTSSLPFVIADKLHLADLLYDLHIWHVSGLDTMGDLLVGDFCQWLPDICTITLEVICGWDLSNANASRTDVYLQSTDSTSTHNLQHGFQCVDADLFQYFDYGKKENQELYGQDTPPSFPLENVDVPFMLYYGGHDSLVVQEDIEGKLIPSLTNVQYVIPPRFVEEWNHADPMFAMNGTIFEEITGLVVQYGPTA